MTFVSYAQNGEDVVVARAFGERRSGFYVDVGASDPVVDSVTKHFYDHGWSGVNVEPSEAALAGLNAARPRDVNVGVVVGAVEGSATFYELPLEMMGCSTLSRPLAERYRREGWVAQVRTIEMTTLAQICEEHVGSRTVDFMKIDVEGSESSVLAGADFERWRPRLLIVEATLPGTAVPAYDDWEPSVFRAGYEFALFDGLNRFYVRREDGALGERVAAPANYFDDYLPYRCVRWKSAAADLDEAEAARRAAVSAHERTALEAAAAHERRERAEAEMHAARFALSEALASSEADRARVRAFEAALQRTRTELAGSRAALRDARTELAASRNALTAAIDGRGREP